MRRYFVKERNLERRKLECVEDDLVEREREINI